MKSPKGLPSDLIRSTSAAESASRGPKLSSRQGSNDDFGRVAFGNATGDRRRGLCQKFQCQLFRRRRWAKERIKLDRVPLILFGEHHHGGAPCTATHRADSFELCKKIQLIHRPVDARRECKGSGPSSANAHCLDQVLSIGKVRTLRVHLGF